MAEIAIRMWHVVGALFAAAAIAAVVTLSDFAGEELRYAPAAAVFGYLMAAPVAMALARIFRGVGRGIESGQTVCRHLI